MKQTKILKILLIAFVLAITNCQYDDSAADMPTTEKQPRVYMNKGNDVSKIAIEHIRWRSNNSMKVSVFKGRLSFANKDELLARETALGTVDTSKEIVVVNETNTKHTFNVTTLDEDSTSITNLIVVVTPDNTYEYFIRYNFENSVLFHDNGTVDISNFSGIIEYFDNNGDLTATVNYASGIVVAADGNPSPCPEDSEENGETGETGETGGNNTGSGGGGTSSGGSGSTGSGSTSGNSGGSGGGSSGSGSGGGGGCDIYYVDTDGERWELDEWEEGDGDSCCMYLVVNCGSGHYSASLVARMASEPCDEGPAGILIEEETESTELCNRIAAQIADADYASKVAFLKTQFNAATEKGFAYNASNNAFINVTNSSNNGHTLHLPEGSNVMGYIHTHLNDKPLGMLGGMEKIEKRIRMFSPKDVRTFLNYLLNAHNNGNDTLEVFGTMISSQGMYTIRFDGDINSMQNAYTAQLKNYLNGNVSTQEFIKYIEDFGREKGFLKFLQDKVGISGMNLYKITNSGNVKRKFLNSKGGVKTNRCE